MPHVRFNESYTPTHPPKNARPLAARCDDEAAAASLSQIVELSKPELKIMQMQMQEHQQRIPSPGTTHTTTTVHHNNNYAPATATASTSTPVISPLLNGHCAKCNHPFGKLANKFEKLTGSYYVLLHSDTAAGITLRPDGEPQRLDSRHEALGDW